MKVDIFKKKKSSLASYQQGQRYEKPWSLSETYLFRTSSSYKKSVLPENEMDEQIADEKYSKTQYSEGTYSEQFEEDNTESNLEDYDEDSFQTQPIALENRNFQYKTGSKSSKELIITGAFVAFLFLNFVGLFTIYSSVKKIQAKPSELTKISESLEVIDSEVYFLNEKIKDGLIDKNTLLDEIEKKLKSPKAKKKYLTRKQARKNTKKNTKRSTPKIIVKNKASKVQVQPKLQPKLQSIKPKRNINKQINKQIKTKKQKVQLKKAKNSNDSLLNKLNLRNSAFYSNRES